MKHRPPYLVGLTGGIGSGKSTVADLFNALGTDVIDADAISRHVVEPGSPLLTAIGDHFGAAVITATGRLDRAALRDRVFADPGARAWLEDLLHPAIRQEIKTRVNALRGDYAILVVPLLLESGHYDFVDEILVVDVPEAVQVERAMQRDGTTEAQVRAIMATQVSREARLEQADDVLDNTVSLDDLEERVRELHGHYLEAARHARQT